MKIGILALIGATLFFLVMSVLYFIILLSQNNPNLLVAFAPFVVLTGFFIFLVAAFLVAISISKKLEKI